LRTAVCQSCPREQRHQYFLFEPAPTIEGVVLPFFVGCHSAALSGAIVARELVTDTRTPAQNGQSIPRMRSPTAACH
jgi:hypothetical protein